jgi:alpha,alpha-trehalase
MAQKEIFELEPLFADVQMQQVFADGKAFVDCTPKENTDIILEKYLQQKDNPAFNLKEFVFAHFELPKIFAGDFKTAAGTNTSRHINNLWAVLTREPDEKKGSLIPLPFPYIVPGGRFGEVYYWDSYFTMLGLKASGKFEMIENMVGNFSHLIKAVGFIPNGNRTYYLGRSQPPFYSLMVQLLAEIKGKNTLVTYLQTLQAEYNYWMKGADELNENYTTVNHVVRMKDGELMNRYCDAFNTARPESYREDVELTHQSSQDATTLYKHLRAGAESGWDYSSRWFKDGQSFSTIHTADIIPVDLNCLLYYLEHTIAEAYGENDNEEQCNHYKILADKRKQAIQKYCWNEAAGFYFDYDLEITTQKSELTLAGIAPLYFKIATQQQADLTAEIIQAKFLKPGGVVTTLKQTGQQWDAPNGWAPLQWMTFIGLQNYGHHSMAKTIAERWLALNDKVFAATGKMMEKYNVEDISQLAGGGEYPSQDGFGWTNGVYLALTQRLNQ